MDKDWLIVISTGASAIIGSGLLATAVTLIFQNRKELKARREKAESDRREFQVRLGLVVQEAVAIQETWLDCIKKFPGLGPTHGGGVYPWIPFELTSAEQVNDLIRLGASRPVITAIFSIKRSNSWVSSHLKRAQEEYSVIALKTDRIRMTATENNTPFETLFNGTLTIRNAWEETKNGIRDLLDAAIEKGLDVGELEKRYKASIGGFLATFSRKSEPTPPEP